MFRSKGFYWFFPSWLLASCFYLLEILTFIRCFLHSTIFYLTINSPYFFCTHLQEGNLIKGKRQKKSFSIRNLTLDSFSLIARAVANEIKFNLCKVNRQGKVVIPCPPYASCEAKFSWEKTIVSLHRRETSAKVSECFTVDSEEVSERLKKFNLHFTPHKSRVCVFLWYYSLSWRRKNCALS